jgi:hypothetical protein
MKILGWCLILLALSGLAANRLVVAHYYETNLPVERLDTGHVVELNEHGSVVYLTDGENWLAKGTFGAFAIGLLLGGWWLQRAKRKAGPRS